MYYAIEKIGYGKRTRYTLRKVTQTGTVCPVDGKCYPTEEAAQIAAAITDQKTVRIDLTNGNTVKVEADAVKSMPFCGYISSWRVSAGDRKYIPQTPYGRPDEIKVSDILKIWHGAKLLYVA